MKNALITLVAIFVLVLIVIPLVYIAFGKIQNPVDLISSNITNHTFANQNYVPDPSGPADPTVKDSSAFDVDLESRCYASSTNVQKSDIVEQIDPKTQDYAATSTNFRFAWTLPGTWSIYPPAANPAKGDLTAGSVDISGGATPETTLDVGLFASKEEDPACVSYFTRTFDNDQDSGRFLAGLGRALDSQGRTIREQGVITIRGIRWYWYGFTKDPVKYPNPAPKDNSYYILYNTYRNGISYTATFWGNQSINGTYRTVANAAVQDIGSLILH